MTPNKKGFSEIIFIIIIIVLVGAVGFFVYQNNQLKQDSEQTTLIEEQEVVNSGEDMSDWEDYKSSTYQIKYPSDMDVSEQEGSVLVLTKLGATQTKDTELFDGIILRFQPRELGISPKELAKLNTTDMGMFEVIEPVTNVNLSGYDGVGYVIEGLGRQKYYILQNSQGTLLIEIADLTVDPEEIGYSSLVDQILSTFEFVE